MKIPCLEKSFQSTEKIPLGPITFVKAIHHPIIVDMQRIGYKASREQQEEDDERQSLNL